MNTFNDINGQNNTFELKNLNNEIKNISIVNKNEQDLLKQQLQDLLFIV